MRYLFGMVLCLLIASQHSLMAVETNEIVDGIVARSDALFSGRIHYGYRTSYGDKYGNLGLSFQGRSWARRSENGGIEISHDGKHVEYVPQSAIAKDGQILNSAAIGNSKKIEAVFPFPPYFAGSFWYASSKQFVKDNRRNAIKKEPIHLDGRKVYVIEWKVGRENVSKAFHAFTNALIKGGTLRVFTAPELGWALPRVEYVSATGEIETSFSGSDFIGTERGIFIPKKMRMDVVPSQFFLEYHITAVNMINEQLPDADFQASIPIGTSVADTRGTKGATFFRVGESSGSSDLSDIIIEQGYSAGIPGTWLAIAVAGVTLGAVTFYIRRRRTIRSAKADHA